MDMILLGCVVLLIIGIFIIIFPKNFFKFYSNFNPSTLDSGHILSTIIPDNPEKAVSFVYGLIFLIVGIGLILFSF